MSIDGIGRDIEKRQVTLRLPVDVANAMKAHCLGKQTYSKYVSDLIRANLRPRPSDDPRSQLRGNW